MQKGITGMLGLSDIKSAPDILSAIKWDVTPRILMEPRFKSRPEDVERLKEIVGYMFYIETQCEPPALILMKVGRSDIESTVGRIDEIPPELIKRAIDNPVERPVYGMYAITDEIKEWLKRELNI